MKIAILNVATILAQVERDAVGAAKFSERRGPHGIRLVRLASFANSGDVVDVNSEECLGLLSIADRQ